MTSMINASRLTLAAATLVILQPVIGYNQAPPSDPISSVLRAATSLGFASGRLTCAPADRPLLRDVGDLLSRDVAIAGGWIERSCLAGAAGPFRSAADRLASSGASGSLRASDVSQITTELRRALESAIAQSSCGDRSAVAGLAAAGSAIGRATARAACVHGDAPFRDDLAAAVQSDLAEARTGLAAAGALVSAQSSVRDVLDEMWAGVRGATATRAYNDLVSVYQNLLSAIAPQPLGMPSRTQAPPPLPRDPPLTPPPPPPSNPPASTGDCATCARERCAACAQSLIILCQSTNGACQACLDRSCRADDDAFFAPVAPMCR